MVSRKATSSEWIVVKDSGIHGKGIFATKEIPKGTQVIEYIGKIVGKVESGRRVDDDLDASKKDATKGAVYIFELNNKIDIDGNVSWNIARLINHSCNPNCETTGDDEHIWISAMRNIKKDEEISYNYGYDIDDFEEHPCWCGSKKCVGYILDETLWTKLNKTLKRRKRNKLLRAKRVKRKELKKGMGVKVG